MIVFDCPSPNCDDLSHPVAFCHFRFDYEEDESVLYLYEIQVDDDNRSKGLGTFMIHMMELLAIRTRMEKVMLTVQAKNKRAQSFYEKCGFEIDPSSPTGKEAARLGYKIFSKSTARGPSLEGEKEDERRRKRGK